MSSRTEISSDSSSSISSTLLSRLRNHDSDAWQRLVYLYGPLVYDWCRQRGLQAADASDVFQETFRAVLRGLVTFRRDQPSDSFRGWLWTITRNKIRDHYRDRQDQPDGQGGTDAWQQLQQFSEEEPKSQSDSGTATVSPIHRALELVRQDFGETTWQAFWQVTMERRSAAEVASELEISVNAVRKAKARVLRRLREEFGCLE